MEKKLTERQREMKALQEKMTALKADRLAAALDLIGDGSKKNLERLVFVHIAVEAVFAAQSELWKKYPAKAHFGTYRVRN